MSNATHNVTGKCITGLANENKRLKQQMTRSGIITGGFHWGTFQTELYVSFWRFSNNHLFLIRLIIVSNCTLKRNTLLCSNSYLKERWSCRSQTESQIVKHVYAYVTIVPNPHIANESNIAFAYFIVNTTFCHLSASLGVAAKQFSINRY